MSYCSHTTKAPIKATAYAVSQQLLPQFVANLSLISYFLPWSWRIGGVLGGGVLGGGVLGGGVLGGGVQMKLMHITDNYYYIR